MSIKDGGQAYPCAGLSGLPNDNFINPTEGMSLRDHFAGLAMQGSCACPDNNAPPRAVANWAYEIADAMLAARERK